MCYRLPFPLCRVLRVRACRQGYMGVCNPVYRTLALYGRGSHERRGRGLVLSGHLGSVSPLLGSNRVAVGRVVMLVAKPWRLGGGAPCWVACGGRRALDGRLYAYPLPANECKDSLKSRGFNGLGGYSEPLAPPWAFGGGAIRVRPGEAVSKFPVHKVCVPALIKPEVQTNIVGPLSHHDARDWPITLMAVDPVRGVPVNSNYAVHVRHRPLDAKQYR